MNLHWLLHNRRARFPQVTAGEWIELACMASCWALLLGFMAATWFRVPWLYVVSLIPAGLSILSAHFHDWSRDV